MPIDIGYSNTISLIQRPELNTRDGRELTTEKRPINDRDENRRQGERVIIDQEAIDKKVEARSEAQSITLQRFRDPEELPRRTQDALNQYQSTLQASSEFDENGGELVGVDIFV
ncbi:MAG: hypothetical protein MI864_22610 [Pseudomonadales bacterium]|uniref:Uncharacterized protein n=1 Tax=Oleiphilus messinensis TaxID=141451 RepID=A0A1Y0IG88_9GAMM|nr:hypothetical protein [Oleiphilus messinensis]ARU58413.1 hypothetical protein OLMES_4417 [Oleiphilus messinensis]MCG8613313.1 hypothetical protein [Pseudomonadales bacterium]